MPCKTIEEKIGLFIAATAVGKCFSAAAVNAEHQVLGPTGKEANFAGVCGKVSKISPTGPLAVEGTNISAKSSSKACVSVIAAA